MTESTLGCDIESLKAEAADVSDASNAPAIEPLILLWTYRILFALENYKGFVAEKEFNDDWLAKALGFGEVIDDGRAGGQPHASTFDRARIIREMRHRWEALERRHAAGEIRKWASESVHRLGERLGLTDLDTEILDFRLAFENHKILRKALPDSIDDQGGIAEILSAILGRDAKRIHEALSPVGTLISSGILTIDSSTRRYPPGLRSTMDVLGCISDEIHCAHDDPLMYFRSRLVRSEPARLSASHFPHVAHDIGLLSEYLARAGESRSVGVNVLIHGRPGTGKSEFTRMIAARLNWDLVEVASSRRDGHALDGNDRFRAYRLGQCLLSKSSGCLILFDEVEDIFRESRRRPDAEVNPGEQKALVNRILETNPVPAFWITNDTRNIDDAFLRRFDYVLALDVPPRSVRAQVLNRYLSGLPVSEDWKKKMVEHEELVPAVVERAAKVIRALKSAEDPAAVEKTLSRVLGNTLEVMQLPREPRSWQPLGAYRRDILNTDCDLEELARGLVEHGKGRMCFYGPPGTGKTALGRHLAEILDRPLLVRRASDIVSPWVGVTEQNIARMFRQGMDENAVLLLDEADTFLQDRQKASYSWEISGVNEMLTQMEGYEGVFIISTNLMATIDAAALRRFDLKIRFDYLKPGQAWTMFEETRTALGIADAVDLSTSIASLELLTPGDFANVARQSGLRPIRSSMALLQRLRAECEMKPEGRRQAIGFVDHAL